LQALQWRDEQLTYDLQAVRRPTLMEKTLIELGIRTYLTIPLRSQDELIGTLNLGKRQVEPFSSEDLEIAHELADQLAIALKQSLLYQATRRQLNELTLLQAAAAACASALSEEALIAQITEIIGHALPSDHFGVILRDEQFDDLVLHPTYHGLSENQQAAIITDKGAIAHTFTTKQPYRLNRPTLAKPHSAIHPFTQSELCVPLIAGENVIGVINIGSFRLDAFTTQDERLLTTIAGQLATAIVKIRLFVQTEQELERRRRIEDPRAVDVKGQPICLRNLPDLRRVLRSQRDAAAHVLCVLDANEPRDGVMHVLGLDRGADVIEQERAVVLILHRAGMNPA
jgi:GAF domain-containing protein